MRNLAKAFFVLLALLPVGLLVWLAIPQFPLLWADHSYWQNYAISLMLTTVIMMFQMMVALLAAYGLARWNGQIRNSVYLLYCLLTLLPVQVMLLPNYLICRELGLLNTQLAIVLLGVFSPLSVFLLARSMQRIRKEQSEAALLDGAGEWDLFRYIYLPQVKDTAWIAAGLAFLDQWSVVETPLVLLSDEKKHPLSIILARSDFPLPYAGAAVYILPIIAALLVIVLPGQRILRKRVIKDNIITKRKICNKQSLSA